MRTREANIRGRTLDSTLDRRDAGLTLDFGSPAWRQSGVKPSNVRRLTLDRTLDSVRSIVTLDSPPPLGGAQRRSPASSAPKGWTPWTA